VEGDSKREGILVEEAFEEKEVWGLSDAVELENVVEAEAVREGSRLAVIGCGGIPSNSSIHTQKRKKLSTERALKASF